MIQGLDWDDLFYCPWLVFIGSYKGMNGYDCFLVC